MQLFDVACILGIVVIINALSNEQRYDNYIAVLKNCLKELGLSEEVYAYASVINNTDGAYDKAKCADLCMFKALKIMKPDGHIDLEKALEHLLSGEPGVQRDIMKTNIETCSKKKEDNDCDTAHNMMTCAVGTY
uniref:Odorant-binding protein 18 n=1 Tax=Chouioia cunea TaxID=1570515 RepID=A0A6B9CIG8_9HYME|nr:odorant-binding protein 18 [Chouioia cunea]